MLQSLISVVGERTPTPSFLGDEILGEISKWKCSVLNMHPRYLKFKKDGVWTHKTIFHQLLYWRDLRQSYSLDVMLI